MARAKKLPSGNWRVRVLDYTDEFKKKHYKSFTGTTAAEAEFLASEYRLTKKNKSKSKSNITLKDALEKFLAAKSSVLSPSTLRSYQIMADNRFGLLNNMKLIDITDEVAQIHFDELSNKYSLKYVKNVFSLMTAAMSFCKAEPPKITYPKRNQTQVDVPTLTEIKEIIKILEKRPEIQCQILLAIMCSLRASEIYALTPEDVIGNMLYINKAYVRGKDGFVIKETTKTSSGTRAVMMPETVSTLINKAKETTKPGERLFKGAPNTLLSNFKTLLRQNNIKPYTVHSMRHAFAALMHLQGVPDQYIMRLGGWKTSHVLKRIYQYAFDDETKTFNEEANKFMDSLNE